MNKKVFRHTALSLISMSSVLCLSTPAWADITLGAILPLTGTTADIGEDQRRGIELAVKQINANGGVLGQPLNVLFEDSAGNAMTALNAVRKLDEINHVPVVIGTFASSVTIPVGQYLEKKHKIHLNISGSSTDIRKIGDHSYSMIGLDDLSAKLAAEDAFKQGYKRIVLIAPNGAYGQGMEKQFTKRFRELGGKVLSSVLYKSGQPTYRSELQRLSHTRPDAYIYTSWGQDAIVLNRDAYQLGLNDTPWYGMYLTMSTGGAPAQYTQGQIGMEVESLGAKGKNYVAQYQAEFKQKPQSAYSSYAYDSVMLAAKAITTAGKETPDAIQAALLKVAPNYVGITGPFNLDADHLRTTQPYRTVKINNGEIVKR